MINIDKKHATKLAIILSVFVLFSLTQERMETKHINRVNNISETNVINSRNIPAKQLFLECWLNIKNNYYCPDMNKQNWAKWKKRYIHKIKTQEDAYVAINSMLASLDDSYSKFLSQEEFQEQNSAINSKLYGIGINIASFAGKIYIANVIENAPAYNADVKTGDIILKINNTNTNGVSIYEVAKIIRGQVNQPITLELLRGSEKLTKTIKRQEIKIKTVEAKKLTDDIGYIRISSFIGYDTPKDFVLALNKLSDTKGLIIDVRGNSGGLFQNAIVISNLFMEKGTIVSVLARKGKNNVYSAKNEGCIYKNPLVILIDSNSASSSEILASALHDNKRAVLIGTKTYGKGLVQKVFSMPNKTGMNLTIARYLTPGGADINKNGIKPDYTVTLSHDDFINNNDSQLNYAKNYLEKIF